MKEFEMTSVIDNEKKIEGSAKLMELGIETNENVNFFTKLINNLIPDIFKSKIIANDTYFDMEKNTFNIKFYIEAPSGRYDLHISISCMPRDKNDTYVHFMKIQFPDGVSRKFTYESTSGLIA